MQPYAHKLAELAVAAADGADERVRWLCGLVAELGPVSERIEARDAVLREAAALVSGSAWDRAVVLSAVAAGLKPENARIANLVGLAATFAPLPGSSRQYLRIVG